MIRWLQRFFVQSASAAMRFVPEWVRHTFLPVTMQRLLDGYAKNSAVAACTTTLAFSFPEPPLMAGQMQDGRFEPDYSHPINDLLRQPNPDMGQVELMQYAVTYAAIGGNLYLWKQRSENGRVVALWPFSSVQISPVPGETTADGFVKEYEYDAGDGQLIPIPKEDVIHWKWMPDPAQPWRGIGAIEFAIRDSDRDSEASAYIYSLLKNNAVPPVVVTLAEGDELTEPKADRLRKQWKAKLGGENAGNIAFLEAGMKAEKMGFDLQQLAAEALNAVPESRIAAAFRVPPVVAGLSVGLKRSDYGDQAARRAFTELTLAALWRSLASEMLNGLREDYKLSPDFALQFDLRQVRALQEEETKLWERVTLAFDRGVLTRAETKQYLLMKPGPGDDVYKVSLASEFVPAGRTVIRDTGSEGKRLERKSSAAAAALRRIRVSAAKQMETALAVYYSQLAEQVVQRATGKAKANDLPDADDLVTPQDRTKLEQIVKRHYVLVLELSWETWNIALGVEKAFDLDDPLVTRILSAAGTRVKDIEATTLSALRDALQYASEQGWGVDELVRGDPENGVRGLREIVAETYKDRARVIARTELGEAQNTAAVSRYKDAGVSLVEILDNGNDDDDEACKVANGQIWTLSYFAANSLEHPNCTRAAAPYFGDATPDKE